MVARARVCKGGPSEAPYLNASGDPFTCPSRLRQECVTSAPQGRTLEGVFERFTERARQVVVLAQDEARGLRHNYIGTEHLLLGLLREDEGVARRVLESLGISLDEARAQVVRIVGEGEAPPAHQIPFTPRAKKVLELSLREAIRLRHDYIGTEHILLGLVHENEGVAVRILLDFGVDDKRVREAVFELVSPGTRPRAGLRRRPRAATFRTQPHPQWEYRIERRGALDHEAEGLLAALGAEGWELTAVVPAAEGGLQLVLKRRCDRPAFGAVDVEA